MRYVRSLPQAITGAGAADKAAALCETSRMAVNKTETKTANKTTATGASVEEFLAAVEHPVRHRDGLRLLELMAAATGPERVSVGAANARRPPSRFTCTSPAPHSWTSIPSCRGIPPASSQACAEPRVGWPAQGNSSLPVKILTR